MSNVISSASLHEKIDRQHQLLGLEFEDHGRILDYIRDRLHGVIGERELTSSQDLTTLCKEIETTIKPIFKIELPDMLGNPLEKSLEKALKTRIKHALSRSRDLVEKEGKWLLKSINSIRAMQGLVPDKGVQTDEQVLQEIPEAEKQAMRVRIQQRGLPEGLYYQLLADLHPGRFRNANEESVSELRTIIGKTTEIRPPPRIPEMPARILTNPDVAWFRQILFNMDRNQLLPLFDREGADGVWYALEEELLRLDEQEKEKLSAAKGKEEILKIQQEYALNRRYTNALLTCFIEADGLPRPDCLREEINERPYPDRQQKMAAYDMLKFGGRLYEGGGTGSGKTGAVIYALMLAIQRGEVENALLISPACTQAEWRMALSDDSQFGYFKEGKALKEEEFVFIDGSPDERPEQWEKAKTAKIRMLSLEMARGETRGIKHIDLLKALASDFFILDEAHRARNTAKNATVIEDGLFSANGENGDMDVKEIRRQQITDMSLIYEVSRESPYRVFASATPVSNTTLDLVGSTIALNAEPSEYRSKAKPQQHRLLVFDAFLEANGLPKDKNILDTLSKDSPSARRLTLNWQDVKPLRRDISEYGREIPRRFLPFFYKPPKEACVPVPEYPDPIIERRIPLSITEQAICDSIRQRHGLSTFRKIGMMTRAETHPYGVDGRPETGQSVYKRLREWIDLWRSQGVKHIVVASPQFAQGMTKDMKGYSGASIYAKLKQDYESQNVPVVAHDGTESGHKALSTPSLLSGRMLTKTQSHIEKFAHTGGIQIIQKDVVGIGINEYARAGIGHVTIIGYDWTEAAIRQFIGRFPRPGQTGQVQIVILLPDGICTFKYDQAQRKNARNDCVFLGRALTEEEQRLFNEKPSKQPIGTYAKSDRERFKDLCAQMSGRGKEFILNQEFADLFVELYNKNWESSFNGNVLRLVGAVAEKRIAHMREERRKKRGHTVLPSNEGVISVADDAAGTFGFHRTMKHAAGLDIHTSDLEPKMISEGLGKTILGEQYRSDRVHKNIALDEAICYPDNSMDMRITSLALDLVAHKETPHKRGREMMRVFLESYRILKKENAKEVPGEWTITLPTQIFKGDARRYQLFLQAFPYFGFKMILHGKARAISKDGTAAEDPFEVLIFTIQVHGEPCVDENTPWDQLPTAVRHGLDFRRLRDRKGKRRKKSDTKPQVEKGEGSYYDIFAIEPVGGHGGETVEYTTDPDRGTRKEYVRRRHELLRQSTDAVRFLLRTHATIEEIPSSSWSQLCVDDVLTDPQDVLKTPKPVRDAYATSIIATLKERAGDVPASILALNKDQKKGSLVYRHEKSGRYLVFANAQGNTAGDKYYMDKTGNGKNGSGKSGQAS